MNKLNLIILIGLALMVSIPASAAITHRYDFTADANDVVGGLETVLESGAVVQDGVLVLSGGTSPAARAVLDAEGIAINTYTEGVSIETWFTATTLSGWTRVFDFGDTSGSDGGYYWFYTPSGPGNSRLALSTGGFPGWSTGEEIVNGPVLTTSTKYHLICVYDPAGGTNGDAAMRIYQDGVLVGENNDVTMALTDVHDAFAYIGSAVYPGDPELQGTVDEFRIYDKPLTEAEARFTKFFGPDDAYPIALRTLTPADGTEDVSITPEFSWTPEPWVNVDSYTLYLGTDPNIADPNMADVSAISDLAVSLEATSYTVPVENALKYNQSYSWRVDTVDVDTTVYQGVGMMLVTEPETPSFTDQPDLAAVFAGQTAEFSATSRSVSSFTSVKWFKMGSPDTEVTDADADITIVTTYGQSGINDTATSTLTIANTEAADLGSYYMQAANVTGPSDSQAADLIFKDLIAYWPFNDDLVDATGHGYDGTAMSATTSATIIPTFAAGEVGQAVNLDGTEAYIDLPDGVGDDFRSGLTFNVWAYPRTAANWARFLTFNNGENNDNIFFTRNGTSNTLRIHIYRGNSGSGGVLDATDTLELNVWQMLTVTMTETGQAALYKNGDQVAAGTIQTPNLVARTNNWMGDSAWSGDALYNGLLDDVRVYNYALTPTEVAELYTDVRTDEYVCVEDPENPLTYDVNGDCQVTIDDIVELAGWWLTCERVPSSACLLP